MIMVDSLGKDGVDMSLICRSFFRLVIYKGTHQGHTVISCIPGAVCYAKNPYNISH